MTRPEKIYALVIIAHPDDESFLMAGTTMKFEAEGKIVNVICATHGEKGADRLDRHLNETEMATLRTRELQTACEILGCECKKFFDWHDGSLDQVNFEELVTELTREINSARPEIVLTFGEEGISGHRDHITIGRAVLSASQRATPKPLEVWRASIPASKALDFHEHMEKRKIHRLHFIQDRLKGVPDERLMKIDVRKYKDSKLKAIEAHQSQHLPHLVWPHFLEYECFEIIKLSLPAGRQVDAALKSC